MRHYMSLLVSFSTEEIRNLQRENENSPGRNEIKLRKNEIKLRKNEIKLRKNFLIPHWRFLIFYRGNFDFLGGVLSGSSKCVGKIGPLTFNL